MFVLISKVLDQAHRDLLLSVEISHNGNKILCPLLIIEFSECLLERQGTCPASLYISCKYTEVHGNPVSCLDWPESILERDPGNVH